MAKWLEISDSNTGKTVSINSKYIVAVSHGGPGTKTTVKMITGDAYLIEADYNFIMRDLVPLSLKPSGVK